MQKNSILNQLASELAQGQGGGSRPRNRRKQPKGGNSRQRARTSVARGNPVRTSPGARGGVPLSLTNTQFTATSPLNLFEYVPASSPGGLRVRGRELVCTVSVPASATGAFTLATLTGQSSNLIPPAFNWTPGAFPRLSAYAQIYEEFIFHRSTFLFQSNQPTTAGGALLMCIDYDATDGAPASVSNVMRNISSTMSNIYSDASLQGLKSLSRLPKFFTSVTSSTEQAQLAQWIQGNLWVALEGVSNSQTSPAAVGYIIVDYDVEFYTPQ